MYAPNLLPLYVVNREIGEGTGTPLQYSCLESPMDRGAWLATVHGVSKELDPTEQLNNSKALFLGAP